MSDHELPSSPLRLAQLRDEQGHAMTPTQYALHHARKQRLARIAAAATTKGIVDTSVVDPSVARETRPEPAAPASVPPAASRPEPQGRKAPWFHIESETEAPDPSAGPGVREIQHAVCAHYGVSLRDLLSPCRHASIVRPRQVAVYLCKQMTALSMLKIGHLFGGRDHTTILVSNRKIAALLKTDAALAARVAALTEAITRQAGER
jgi:hypothetical protein